MITYLHSLHKKSANLKKKILNFPKLSSCPKMKRKNSLLEKITNSKMILNTHQSEHPKIIIMSILKTSLIINLSMNTKNLSKLKKLKNSIKIMITKSISVDILLPYIFKIFFLHILVLNFCATLKYSNFCKKLKTSIDFISSF